MKVLSGAYWNSGERSMNQDSLTLQQIRTKEGRIVLAAVSDGIGGLSEGEIASGYILEQLVKNFYQEAVELNRKGGSKRKLQKNYLRILSKINYCMNQYGTEKGIKLGATLSLLLLWKRNYLIFHLGDSRIYQYSRRKLKQLTKDHSDGGRGLMKCLGSFPWQYPDIYTGSIWGKSGFLLCTDGFYKTLRMEESIETLAPSDICSEKQIEKRLQALAQKSMQNGGTDNISAIYMKVTI